MQATSTETVFHCLHCGVLVPESDIAGGWCETCGKKLPESLRSKKKRGATVPTPVDVDTPDTAPASRFVWGVVAVLVLGVAAFFLLARVGMAG
jgi:hypothetical protein